MMLIVLPLLLVIAISLILNFKLIDVIHKLDANIDDNDVRYGWTTENILKENDELRYEVNDLRSQVVALKSINDALTEGGKA
jgi:hypothetical protein